MPEVFDENRPIYMQIMDLIKKQMISKEFMPGEKLPSVRDMSKQLEVNPNTVQRAYLEMEREMLVYTKRGQGTFIVDEPEVVSKLRQEMVLDRVATFVREMEEFGFSHDELLKIIEKHLTE
jgi:DNA-binding transcriptional regulator YhcF (GntR family)